MPIVREERKAKEVALKTAVRPPMRPSAASNDSSHGGARPPQSNRPRLTGTPKHLPPQPSPRELDDEDEEDGLLSQLVKSKGKPLETNREKLTQDDRPFYTPSSSSAAVNPLDKRLSHGKNSRVP